MSIRASIQQGKLAGYQGDLSRAFEVLSAFRASPYFDAEAQHILGSIHYERGEYESAVDCFRKAAALSYAPAEVGLGRMYQTGRGVDENLNEAMRWFAKAAQRGDAEANFNLGDLYYSGAVVTKNFARALGYFVVAASKGHASSLYSLGLMHFQGDGTSASGTSALKYFTLAADYGDPRAHAAIERLLAADCTFED